MYSRFDRQPVEINTYNNGGIGFIGLLTLIFIVLKLTGVIAWSWVWVLAPLWIGFLAFIGIIAVIIAVGIWASK